MLNGLRRRLPLLGLTLAVLLALPLAAACGGDDDDTTGGRPARADTAGEPAGYAEPDLLAETDWLAGKLGDPSLVIVDIRKKEAYEAGHIPGAVWYDQAALKDPDEKLYVIRESLFAEKAGALGIDTSKEVVIYDDGTGLWATRLWWVLDYYGHPKARVVNGGWAKWEKEGRPVTKEVPNPTPAKFVAKPNPDVICALDYVKEKATNPDPNVVILDARTQAEYTGADVRAARGGHIPNAVNLDWQASLTDTDPKVWKPADQLRAQFATVGITKDTQVITYCQTGVRAAHSLFTLRLVGLGKGNKVYDGSWAEWGNSKETPVQQ
jgi:thiosulfate/3-mercaptopyruvate sulfurtransferase